MSEIGQKDKSFLAYLLEKYSNTKKIGQETGANVDSALREVERQIS